MPNTTLPTNVTAGTSGHADFHNQLHTEVNRITRDTGLRDISSFLMNGWTLKSGGYAYIRRVDNQVYLYLNGLDGSAATSQAFLYCGAVNPSIPGISGSFAPAAASTSLQTMSPLFRRPVGQGAPWYLFWSSNYFRTADMDSGSAIVSMTGSGVEWQWTAERSWPSTLPPAAA